MRGSAHALPAAAMAPGSRFSRSSLPPVIRHAFAAGGLPALGGAFGSPILAIGGSVPAVIGSSWLLSLSFSWRRVGSRCLRVLAVPAAAEAIEMNETSATVPALATASICACLHPALFSYIMKMTAAGIS